MNIVRAWSSEDNHTVAYLIKGHETYILVNDIGELKELRGQGIDLDKQFIELSNKLDSQDRGLIEVPIHKENSVVYARASAPNGKGRVFRVRVKDILMSRGLNPHGIEQLVIATHTVEYAGSRVVEERPVEEQVPMLLRNNSQLVGLVQGWVMSADVSDTL